MKNEKQSNRLAELLRGMGAAPGITCPRFSTDEDCNGCKYQKGEQCDIGAREADYLIKKGVFAPSIEIGDKINVWSKTLPIFEIDEAEEQIPAYYEGEIVSIKKTRKGWSFKFKVYARWIKDSFDYECGYYTESYESYKYFIYPTSAIGKTVFLTKEEAEEALKGGVE